ncbi:putative aldo/keto reductase [Biscogniauxia marginata]|nr:putative aldo/keto reductase [Biscogniauxia marginata]
MPVLAGKEISNNGLGLMRLTTPGAAVPDEQAFAVLKAALKAGVNCWNGADFYGLPSANSLHLLKRYFTAYPEDAEKVVLCIKSGIADMKTFRPDASPAGLRASVETANSILAGTKKIDVFGMARVDPQVPVEESVRALAALVSEGATGGIQLSEVGADTIRRAARVARIDMVEAEVSLWADEILSNGVAAACAELGIPIVAHTPLGAGVLAGHIRSPDDLPANDYHRFFPRFQPENFGKNLELVDEVRKLAAGKGCTAAQLALSWIKLQSRKLGVPPLIPAFGARSADRVAENTKEVLLTDEDFEAIDKILSSFPVAGTRYPAPAMKLVKY